MSESKGTMLHELLAVETDLSKTKAVIIKEAENTFGNKANLFMGASTTTVLDDQDALEPEAVVSHVSEDVPSKLEYVGEFIANSFDVDFSLADGNSIAKADVVVDGNVIVENAPVLWLLGMEQKIKAIRQMVLAVPTLAPSIVWVKDENHSLPNVYTSKDNVVVPKTAKVFKYVIMDQATKEHKAQIEKMHEDVRIGTITKRMWSSMLPVAEKSRILNNIDSLFVAVKKARQQANTTKVELSDAGSKVVDFIFS